MAARPKKVAILKCHCDKGLHDLCHEPPNPIDTPYEQSLADFREADISLSENRAEAAAEAGLLMNAGAYKPASACHGKDRAGTPLVRSQFLTLLLAAFSGSHKQTGSVHS